MIIALPLGAVLGIARLSDHLWVRVPAAIVVEFFRAIPVLVLMIFGLALYAQYTDVSSDDRPLYAVVTGLVLYNASVLAEIVRAGILALPKGPVRGGPGDRHAQNQVMRLILLPQAVTAMLPAIVSQLVVIVKDTALGGAVLTFPELRRLGEHDERLLRRQHHRVVHGGGRHLHRHQLLADLVRELARRPAAAAQEVDRRGARRPGHHGHRRRRGNRNRGLTPGQTRMHHPEAVA